MKKNVVLIVFEEKTFIKELVKVHTSVVFEFAYNTEQAIEKLNFSAIGAVLVDMSLEIENLRKIMKPPERAPSVWCSPRALDVGRQLQPLRQAPVANNYESKVRHESA